MDLFLQGFWPPLRAGAISYPLMLAACALPLFAAPVGTCTWLVSWLCLLPALGRCFWIRALNVGSGGRKSVSEGLRRHVELQTKGGRSGAYGGRGRVTPQAAG